MRGQGRCEDAHCVGGKGSLLSTDLIHNNMLMLFQHMFLFRERTLARVKVAKQRVCNLHAYARRAYPLPAFLQRRRT